MQQQIQILYLITHQFRLFDEVPILCNVNCVTSVNETILLLARHIQMKVSVRRFSFHEFNDDLDWSWHDES